MRTVDVKKHTRKRKNGASVVRKHRRSTHKTVGGKKYVFVDGFWKHDDYPNYPKDSWSYKKLIKEKQKLEQDLADGLSGRDVLPPRKLGLLTRRIKKINRFLSKKIPEL